MFKYASIPRKYALKQLVPSAKGGILAGTKNKTKITGTKLKKWYIFGD